MHEILGIGFLTALAFGIIMYKINLEFFAKYHWQTDIIISGGLTALFYGTFSGMVTALVAGIFISIFLFISRIIINPV
jgi:hypothetical protein